MLYKDLIGKEVETKIEVISKGKITGFSIVPQESGVCYVSFKVAINGEELWIKETNCTLLD